MTGHVAHMWLRTEINIYIWQCLISCCAQDAPHPGRDPSTLREHDGRAGPAWHRNGPILDRAGPGPSTIKMSLCTLRCQGGPCKTKLGAMPRPNWSVHVPTGSCPGHLEKPKKNRVRSNPLRYIRDRAPTEKSVEVLSVLKTSKNHCKN